MRDGLRKALSFAFPDVVKEIALQKTLKTYRPEIGVTSIMAAAEVKFVSKKQAATAALDGIHNLQLIAFVLAVGLVGVIG